MPTAGLPKAAHCFGGTDAAWLSRPCWTGFTKHCARSHYEPAECQPGRGVHSCKPPECKSRSRKHRAARAHIVERTCVCAAHAVTGEQTDCEQSDPAPSLQASCDPSCRQARVAMHTAEFRKQLAWRLLLSDALIETELAASRAALGAAWPVTWARAGALWSFNVMHSKQAGPPACQRARAW